MGSPRFIENKSSSDEELLASSRSGSSSAFAELWMRHAPAALLVARRFAFSDAEDMVSQAFEEIWEQLGRGVGPRTHFRAYLFTTVRNMSAREYRRKMRSMEAHAQTGSFATPGAGDDYERSVAATQAFTAFQELPVRWQLCLWLLDVEGYPRVQVAEHLGITPNALSVLLKRAREGLRLQWLRSHLPSSRGDQHCDKASLLPAFILGKTSRAKHNEVEAHLNICFSCKDVEADLRHWNGGITNRSPVQVDSLLKNA